ncbi:MAG: hypothetical protein D6704_12785 [Nitrospirae bacterium]|nr:MAG: hypothetical protein D6704_12785 [Nitrospirota bacterium]
MKRARCMGWIALVLSIGLTGCLGTREWQYPPLPEGRYLGITAQQSLPATVVVLPFEDLRGREIREEYWKITIPLVPYGVVIYDRPEEIQSPEPVDQVRFHPSIDFARALADEVREAEIFSSVIFAHGPAIPPSDFVLRGRLYSTRWERVVTTYLLGPLGTVFWILGLPMGDTTTQVTMDLRLTPADDPSQVLWSFAMDFESWRLDSPYYGLEEAVQSYAMALQDTLRPAIKDLVKKAAERIAPFQPVP